MRLGIMQPYFLPYAGYFSLIKHCDLFILLDSVQFIRHGWIERNRILGPGQGWQYIRAPLVRHHRETTIREIRIDNQKDWRALLLRQLKNYRKLAPRYDAVARWTESVLEARTDRLAHLNRHLLESVCGELGITTPIKVFSEMGLVIAPPAAPDEWALNICKAIPDADEYWNPPGGESFFDREKFRRSGITLHFQTMREKPYDQRRAGFEPRLSILDTLMFCDEAEVNGLLDHYDLS